ncbi:hypothetical protein PRIEUP_LOCUS669, partial [Pristimantis euphronides]
LLVFFFQIVAQVACNDTQYYVNKLERCCNRCPPGYYIKKKCTQSSETECQECGANTYAAKWNFATTCSACRPCSMILVEKQPCNATQAAVCVCPDGQHCTIRGALNVCMECEVIPTDEPKQSEPSDTKNIWLITGVLLFLVTAIVVVICLKTRVLKSFGRLIKNKNSLESTPQPETRADIAVNDEVNGGPEFYLLETRAVRLSWQEEDSELNYPVQVSDANDRGE